VSEVRRFLTLAWESEIQLHLPALMGNTAMLGSGRATFLRSKILRASRSAW
jgi:hypothetical protein